MPSTATRDGAPDRTDSSWMEAAAPDGDAEVSVPEWGAPTEGPTAQLIPAASRAGARVEDLALLDLDELGDPDDVDPGPSAPAPDREPLGGRAASWTAGYRDGEREGLEEGRRAGVELGVAEGRQLALDGLRAEVDGLRDGIGTALDAVRDDAARGLADLEVRVAELALAIAEAVLEAEVRHAPGATVDAVRRAMALAPDRGDVLVRCHPDDAALLEGDPTVAPGRSITIAADPSIGRGGCVVEVASCTVDATLAGALERVREVLAG